MLLFRLLLVSFVIIDGGVETVQAENTILVSISDKIVHGTSSQDLLYVDIVGKIELKNGTDRPIELAFYGCPRAALRLTIFDKSAKKALSLDCSAYYCDLPLQKLTLNKGEQIIESIKMPWPIAATLKPLTPGSEYTIVAEFQQGDKVFKSEPAKFEFDASAKK